MLLFRTFAEYLKSIYARHGEKPSGHALAIHSRHGKKPSEHDLAFHARYGRMPVQSLEWRTDASAYQGWLGLIDETSAKYDPASGLAELPAFMQVPLRESLREEAKEAVDAYRRSRPGERPWGTFAEGYCPKREDTIHCVHWWDCEPCCSCTYDGPDDKDVDCSCPRHSPELYDPETGEMLPNE